MDNYLNDPRLQQAQGNFQAASGQANASAQQDVSLPQMLKETLNAKFNDNNPLVAERNNAATAYLSSVPSSYNDVLPENNNGVILNPTQQAMMIQSKQNAYLSPLMSANSRLATQRGGLADVIQGVVQAHKSSTDALAQKAQLAHQSYKDILDELSTKAEEAFKLKSLTETMRHNRVSEGISSSKSGGGSLTDLLKIYSQLKPSAQQAKDAKNAGSGLDDIANIRALLKKDPNIVTKGSGIFGTILHTLGNKDVQLYQKAKDNVKDVFTRLRTGAALNKNEQKEYDRLLQTFDNPATTKDSLDRMEKLYKSFYDRGNVPDVMTWLQQQQQSGNGGSEWEIVQ